jgi:hypothetical protein
MTPDGSHEMLLLSGWVILKSNEIRCCRRRWGLLSAAADVYKFVFIKNNYFLGILGRYTNNEVFDNNEQEQNNEQEVWRS